MTSIINSPLATPKSINGEQKYQSQQLLLGKDVFNFTATRHLAETVEKVAHPCDLVKMKDATLFRLDAEVNGVGIDGCGPGVREDLMVKTGEKKFGFLFQIL